MQEERSTLSFCYEIWSKISGFLPDRKVFGNWWIIYNDFELVFDLLGLDFSSLKTEVSWNVVELKEAFDTSSLYPNFPPTN